MRHHQWLTKHAFITRTTWRLIHIQLSLLKPDRLFQECCKCQPICKHISSDSGNRIHSLFSRGHWAVGMCHLQATYGGARLFFYTAERGHFPCREPGVSWQPSRTAAPPDRPWAVSFPRSCPIYRRFSTAESNKTESQTELTAQKAAVLAEEAPGDVINSLGGYVCWVLPSRFFQSQVIEPLF